MGTDNAYDAVQVGVTYTVYDPAYTAGLKLDGDIEGPCFDGSDENVNASYGTFPQSHLSITEGRPICVEPLGDGKIVGHVTVHGRRAEVRVNCDFSNTQQWRNCSLADMTQYGGQLSVTLPGIGGRRATSVFLMTEGTKPLSATQLIKVARGLTPAAG
jgi:hypothetical protein